MDKIAKLIGIFLGIILSLAFSWGIICGLVKLITICFGLTFSLAMGTGIWLIMILLKATFTSNNKK